jgi:nucleotide-binding universal stress UspA family protein
MTTPSRISQAYLVVADDTPEFEVALRYAARLAKNRDASLFILKVIEIENFQHWGTIEEQLKKELRKKAETEMWNICRKVNELNGVIPTILIEEGIPQEALIHVIKDLPMVKLLILGGKADGNNPGPLVSHFAGKGLSKLEIPLVIIPSNIQPGMISPLIT